MVLQQDALASAGSVFLALLQQLAGSVTGATCVCVLQHEDADAGSGSGSGFDLGCCALQQAELVSASVAAAWSVWGWLFASGVSNHLTIKPAYIALVIAAIGRTIAKTGPNNA